MRTLLAAIAVLVVSAPSLASADVIPPEETACQGSKVKGDACTLATGGKGTCQDSTCTHLDYSRDASTPGSITSPCLKCLDGSGEVPVAAGRDAGDAINPEKAGGCSLAPSSPAGRDLLALGFAGVFSALFLVRRRRRNGS